MYTRSIINLSTPLVGVIHNVIQIQVVLPIHLYIGFLNCILLYSVDLSILYIVQERIEPSPDLINYL